MKMFYKAPVLIKILTFFLYMMSITMSKVLVLLDTHVKIKNKEISKYFLKRTNIEFNQANQKPFYNFQVWSFWDHSKYALVFIFFSYEIPKLALPFTYVKECINLKTILFESFFLWEFALNHTRKSNLQDKNNSKLLEDSHTIFYSSKLSYSKTACKLMLLLQYKLPPSILPFFLSFVSLVLLSQRIFLIGVTEHNWILPSDLR